MATTSKPMARTHAMMAMALNPAAFFLLSGVASKAFASRASEELAPSPPTYVRFFFVPVSGMYDLHVLPL